MDTVATACPYCPIRLKDAANQAGREDVKVVDVAELVAARLPEESPRRLNGH